MVVDTSAVVAMLTEADGPEFRRAISAVKSVAMSAVSLYKTRLVLSGGPRGVSRFPPGVIGQFETWLTTLNVEVVPFDADQAILAHRAYLRFGKGFHRAGLNLADCAAYALATSRGEPLLFKGDDFGRTDVVAALG